MKRNKLMSIASLATFFSASTAFAAEGSAASGSYALAAAIAIGVAAVGGAIGQGLLGSSAMNGMARNPQAKDAMFIPMIIGLALIESLVIYAFVIAILIVLKI